MDFLKEYDKFRDLGKEFDFDEVRDDDFYKRRDYPERAQLDKASHDESQKSKRRLFESEKTVFKNTSTHPTYTIYGADAFTDTKVTSSVDVTAYSEYKSKINRRSIITTIVLAAIIILSNIFTICLVYYFNNIRKATVLTNDIDIVAKAVWDNTNASVVRIETNSGTGSGFVINNNGNIVTNYHVISVGSNSKDYYKDISVYIKNISGGESKRDAKVVNIDTTRDIAILEIKNPILALNPVVFAPANSLQHGDAIVAIGNPLGRGLSVSQGTVNNPCCNINNMPDCIQFDAGINPGNSGGPLFDINSRVVGINTFSYETAPGGSILQLMNFAVPNKEIFYVLDTSGIPYTIAENTKTSGN